MLQKIQIHAKQPINQPRSLANPSIPDAQKAEFWDLRLWKSVMAEILGPLEGSLSKATS